MSNRIVVRVRRAPEPETDTDEDLAPPRRDIEGEAVALLKAAKMVLVGPDVYRAFQGIKGDALVKGHAWRALKMTLGTAQIIKWQRTATRAAALALLDAAAELAWRPRNATVDPLHDLDDVVNASARLKSLSNIVERYIDGRLRGIEHEDLVKYHRPAEIVRLRPAHHRIRTVRR